MAFNSPNEPPPVLPRSGHCLYPSLHMGADLPPTACVPSRPTMRSGIARRMSGDHSSWRLVDPEWRPPSPVAVWCYRRAADRQGHDEERQRGWILVVAGDAGRRMALFRLLERKGLRATVVNDGHEALAMLRTEPFDLVLLDASRLVDPTA